MLKILEILYKLDLNQLAAAIVAESTGESEPVRKILEGKKADSSKGGKRGGKTRMELLTDEQRKELALKAANARWNKTPAIEAGVKPKSN